MNTGKKWTHFAGNNKMKIRDMKATEYQQKRQGTKSRNEKN